MLFSIYLFAVRRRAKETINGGTEGWFSYNRRYRFDRRCQFKKWSYDWDDYMRTLHKRSLMPAAIGSTAIAWIARVLSGRLVADRGD